MMCIAESFHTSRLLVFLCPTLFAAEGSMPEKVPEEAKGEDAGATEADTEGCVTKEEA